MKTTNLEISKKLKEIGFRAETFFFWTKAPKLTKTDKDRYVIALANKVDISQENEMFPAYHLETLIEALPDSITREYKSRKDGTIRKFKEELLISKNAIWYRCYDIETSDDANKYWREYGYEKNIRIYSPDDSLANIAGKMLIKLYEAGIINFKK